MADWLTRITAEIDGVTNYEHGEPEPEAAQAEHEVGVLPERMRKLWFLVGNYRAQTAQALASAMALRGDARKEKVAEAEQLDLKGGVLKDLFWVWCRDEFPVLWPKESIGVRKGWKVVWMESADQTSGVRIMAVLGSGGMMEAMFGSSDEEDPDSKPIEKGTTLN
jgi:hypothetical protein